MNRILILAAALAVPAGCGSDRPAPVPAPPSFLEELERLNSLENPTPEQERRRAVLKDAWAKRRPQPDFAGPLAKFQAAMEESAKFEAEGNYGRAIDACEAAMRHLKDFRFSFPYVEAETTRDRLRKAAKAQANTR